MKPDKRSLQRLLRCKLNYLDAKDIAVLWNTDKECKKFIDHLHTTTLDRSYIELEKVRCYRNHSPRHHWLYVSYSPGHYLCTERW